MKLFNICFILTCLVLLVLGCAANSVKVEELPGRAYTALEKNGYSWEDHEIDGMKYRVFYKNKWSPQSGYSVFVVNLTKDKLEVDLLKRTLDAK